MNLRKPRGMKSLFLHDWEAENWEGKTGLEALKKDFDLLDVDLEGVDILLASYTYEDYDGTAFVLFLKDGKLFEVHGSHCSCYGLEGQWDPEETTVEALRKTLEGERWAHRLDQYRAELADIVNRVERASKRAAA